MLNITIPRNILESSHQAVKEKVRKASVTTDAPIFKFITSCNQKLLAHLQPNGTQLEFKKLKSNTEFYGFSLSTGIGQQLKFQSDSDDYLPHLRLYSETPFYFDFTVSSLPQPWYKVWGIVMSHIIQSYREFCTVGLDLIWSTQRLYELSSKGNLTIKSFIDTMEEEGFEVDEPELSLSIFDEVFTEYQDFYLTFFAQGVKQHWQEATANLDRSLIHEIDSVLNTIDNLTVQMNKCHVERLMIDECRGSYSMLTFLTISNELERDHVQEEWACFNTDPRPVVIGLIPNSNSDIKQWIELFFAKLQQLDALIDIFNRIKLGGV